MKSFILILFWILFPSILFASTGGGLLVSLEESTSFGHALGWVVTFNVFSIYFPLLPFKEKKTRHYILPLFLLLSLWIGYLIITSYNLSITKEAILLISCFLPSLLVYFLSLSSTHKVDEVDKSYKKQRIGRLEIFKRYAVSKFFNSLWALFVAIYLYLWSQTPVQKRKKNLRRLGWDVDNPKFVGHNMILHRIKNPSFTCSVSHLWKQIPIYETRSLGLLSKESQKYLEDIIEILRLSLSKKWEREHLSFNAKSILVGKRYYSPNDLLSRIQRKTPLGLKFLSEYLRELF